MHDTGRVLWRLSTGGLFTFLKVLEVDNTCHLS
jgi:hypothetical protein